MTEHEPETASPYPADGRGVPLDHVQRVIRRGLERVAVGPRDAVLWRSRGVTFGEPAGDAECYPMAWVKCVSVIGPGVYVIETRAARGRAAMRINARAFRIDEAGRWVWIWTRAGA